MCHAGPSSLVFFGEMLNSLRWWFTDCSVRRIKKSDVQSLYWSFGFIDISTQTPSTCYKKYKYKKIYFGFTYASSEVHFRSTETQTFYWSIMTADDSIKCWCANSGMTGQEGGSQNPGVCLQAFPSFLPHPLPALLLTPFFAQSLTIVPRSLLLNRTETLATQANECLAPASSWAFACLLLLFHAD